MSTNLIFHLAAFLVTLSLRCYILFKSNKRAIDGYYWSLYRREAINQNKVPPVLEQFILEIRQWYPPLFGYMLSKLSDYFVHDSRFFIILMNLIRLGLIFTLPFLLGINLEIELILFVLVIFFSAPILAYYDNQINSRILGAIFFDFMIILWIVFFRLDIIFVLPLIIITNIILLFLHKMTLQLYVFVVMAISIYTNSFWPVLSLATSLFIAFFFLGYKKYFLAHIEIVKFWSKNKYNLGAHQLYESPIYGSNQFIYQNRLHGGGIKTLGRKLVLVFGMFPMILLWSTFFQPNILSSMVLATILLIIISSFIPLFYCIGAGPLYNYNLVSLLCFYSIVYPPISSTTHFFIYSILFLLSFLAIVKSIFNKSSINNVELEQIIDFINSTNLNRLLVIPFQLPDEIAFKTDRKVFWGGHGLGFLWLEKYFPVMNDRLEIAIKDWNLGAVVLAKSYWPEFFDQVPQDIFEKVFENDSYCILAVKNWENKDRKPEWAMNAYPNIKSQ